MVHPPPRRRRPHPDGQSRPAAASVVALACIAVVVVGGGVSATSHAPPRRGMGSLGLSRTALSGSNSHLRSRPPDTEQYAQWKTKRKWGGRSLAEEGEWEDDDDEGGFHLEDDDDTANEGEARAETPPAESASEGQTTKNPANSATKSEENVGAPIDEKGREKQSHKEDEGIIYSDTVGSKEADPLPPQKPQPPPTGAKEKSATADSAEDEQKRGKEKHSSQSKTGDEEDDMPADTIFDDLLRGFAFAALFCLALVCLHKCCWYACVRCGIFPDERVLEARWRRWQLRKKRSYRNATTGSPRGDVPPLDTRQWGKWMAEHDADGDDGYYYSANRDEDGVWDDEDHSVGAIDFDDGDLVEMAAWHGGDAASEMELEYGEDDELEDRSHDARLFDVEDGGEGVQREASRFFGRKERAGRIKGNAQKTKENKNEANEARRDSTGSGASGVESNEPTPTANDGHDQSNDVTEDSFFDALQKPARKKDNGTLLPSAEASSSPAGTVPNDDNRAEGDDDDDDDDDATNFQSSMIAQEDDRGYDEETDLLGLRSDSPPPLDLAEIEKGLVEQMEKATKFY